MAHVVVVAYAKRRRGVVAVAAAVVDAAFMLDGQGQNASGVGAVLETGTGERLCYVRQWQHCASEKGRCIDCVLLLGGSLVPAVSEKRCKQPAMCIYYLPPTTASTPQPRSFRRPPSQ